MIRIIVREQDARKAANCGGSTEVVYRTFEIDAPALEAYLREPANGKWAFTSREVIGAEIPDSDDISREG